MRKLFYTLFIVAALAFCANAQGRVGAFLGVTTAPDKTDAPKDGVTFFPGATASFETSRSRRFGFKVKADVARPQVPTLFTTDEGKTKPNVELRAHPQAVLNFGRFFGAAGVDVFNHFGLPNREGVEYSRSYGVNPTATLGVRFAKNHEVSATYLFRDKGTDLYGYRANYFWKLPKGIRFFAQADRITFKERNRRGYVDPYYEVDNIFNLGFDIPIFGGGYKH